MLTILDEVTGGGGIDIQSVLFKVYLDAMLRAMFSTEFVLSGGAITGNTNMVPSVAKGSAMSLGSLIGWAAGTVTLGAADSTQPRIDLIVATSGGLAVRAGTPATPPSPPTPTAGDVLLGAAYIAAGDTTIVTSDIQDMRCLRDWGPTCIKKTTTAAVFNNTSAAQTLLSLVLPSGLFLAGKVLSVRMGGDALLNSGTPTLTLTISYGGTTMFADTSANHTADTDREPWFIDFELIAQANNDQALVGRTLKGPAAGVTAPTTGEGDAWSSAGLSGPIYGAAAVDSDAGDRTLLVTMTMSVANAADEFVLDFCTVDLR